MLGSSLYNLKKNSLSSHGTGLPKPTHKHSPLPCPPLEQLTTFLVDQNSACIVANFCIFGKSYIPSHTIILHTSLYLRLINVFKN